MNIVLKKRKSAVLFKFVMLLIILGSCSIFFVANFQKWSQSPVRIYARVLSIIKGCKTDSKTLNSLDQKCVIKKFQKFVDKKNLPDVLAALEDIFSKEDSSINLGTTSCHIPAHIAGEVAYQKGASFSELWDMCSRNCSFGCLHGGFQGMFKEKGEEVLKNLSSACSILDSPRDDDLRSCWHIVGHGVAEYFGGNTEAAIKECLTLPFEKQRRLCILGVRMETLIPSADNDVKTILKSQEYLSFCNKFPEKYRDDCFAEAGYYELKISEDINQTIDICKKVPQYNEIQIRCVTGAGSTFFFAHKSSPETVYAFCSKYGRKELVEECVIGAVDLAASEWDHLRSGVGLCNLVNFGFKGECLAYFGTSLEVYNGKEKRAEICNELNPVDKKSCFGSPKKVRKYAVPVTFLPEER
ncbi:MAG TPA: hypothetical protein VFI61_00270 [Patescibacteria group bacterium]|nr:hypothetical protein [Patescibacteria group bacterium]